MIQIKRNNKVFFTLEDFGEGSKLSYQLMDHHYIILKFTTATPVYFEIGDSVEIPDFGYFELTSSYFPKHNDSDGYDYEMQMDAYYMSWKNKLCKYRPQHGANETSFKLTTTVGVHMNVILGNLKALGLTYNGKEFSVDYTTYNNKAFDVQKRFLIEYGSISILDALNAICSEDALNCEWWIDGSIIYLGYCEMEGQTTFEQDVNVLSMSYSESKSTYITRLYAFGSDRNIPKGYFTGADADVTTDGVATDYLMLPNKEVDSDGFYAKDGYLENVNVVKNDKQAIEGVVMFEDEYPKVESVVSGIKTYDSTVDNDDGTKTTQTFWQVTATDSFATSFKESWIKSNLTLGIKFTSGALMGMEFEVSFKVIDQVNYFEIVANDTYGRTLPDGVMCPKIGDKFFLYNWDATKITDTDLIPAAQLSLFDRAKQYYQKTMISNSNFTCTMDGEKFFNDGTYDYHPIGEQVKLINDMFAQVDADGKHYRNSRIIGMEIPLDIPYDHPQYTVGEKAATSRLGKLEDKVDSITVNGIQIGGTGSGNGGVYVIGLNDSTPASDSNVFSARRSRMEFLSRLQDSTAKGTITWEKVQKLLSGLVVGNSNNENGGSWTPDAEGRSHLITDYLEVRMKAIFEELVIKKTSTIGGKEIISPAGGVVAHKVEEVTVTYNNVSQKAYRCYFLAEQEGDAVDNDFSVNDQVRSESFNVRKGTYHKVGNHFYWRLVIGRDDEPVELEGKKYHYIDLSDTDCATASDVPAKGDVLSQCGNRTDVERQNCLIFSAVDTYSPSISLYHGINSYSFANKEYVEYGVNKQTNKAFFNIYGDMYVGDRPNKENGYEGSSYIKFDSATKQVVIKGKLSAKSTVDGKELSQYIKENSAKGLTEEQVNNIINNSQVITDLQNQVDGAIETWFYEGVPTLTNAPASSWTTDKDKDTHLGDLYYDNKTGKAYRFAKDGSIYKWTIITDTDIAKALSDASKAQETADGKMKVFSAQPTPPYQIGDIWVNATYPSNGSTYKNDVLRCQTDKKAGSQFAIADWIKASKYTDDTVANAAKKAAEDAQKAAQTAQTNVTNLGKTVTNNKKSFDNYVKDGYLEPSEIAAMAQDSKRLEDDFAAAEKSYNEVKGAEVLKSTKELTDLNAAFATLTTAKTELVTYLSDISSGYNAADTNGKATIVSAVGTKFTNFQSAYSAFYDKLGLANAYITSKIYGDLGVVIGDVTSLAYLKKALMDTPDTEINGGLVLTSLIGLRDTDGNTTAGINGITEKSAKGGGIAAWFGGEMVDKDYNDGSKTPANTIFRFDGSGYVAGGAIWWGTDGRVHADPTSFIISEKNLGAYLTFFEPTWKAGSAGTSVADLASLKPNAPFTKLGVSGDATFEGTISFHGIKLTYDATNKAIKVDGNLYATGGISAYGASDAGGGGGLNASVISYARIIEGSYTDADLTSIPNAYAIKALSSRIDNIATELGGLNLSWNNITDKPSTFTPSAHTHKWADITDRITKVSQLTNDAGYLTTHQSLASYYTKTEIDAKGYTTNKGTVTSVALTLPAGLACATKTITTSGTFAITLASGYSIPTTAKQTAWDGAVSAKHTHSNKTVLDGITSAKVTHWDSAYDWYALMTTDEETADGIINKWNEVVSFLANIAQTDTLSGIVDGINKSISDEVTRAKGAEGVNASGISANKTNITTLQGYFISGSAKKALQLTNARKLWGNSFNGTADINGSIIVPSGKYISIGNIKLEYDATNKALKITNTTTDEVANLYTSGGVSAYGVGTSPSSGGGLNGSVKAYADAIKLTTENLSEIASAYSVAKLYSEIQNVASAVPSISVSVPTGGNALTGATYDASTGVITFTKGTFLTAHQSLDGYVNAIAVSGSGNAVTAVTKSGKTITFTKGATYLTSHQSLAAYLKSADAASTYAVVGHTHKVKINGAEKTINPSTGTIVDLGTYLTSHQSLAAYMKTADANNTFSKIGHTHGYASSVKLGETSYAASSNVISLPAYPTALKSPTAITIQANGTSLGSYDGSTAKTFNLTYANVGAASAGHNHDSVYSKLRHTHSYLPLSGGTLTGGLTVNSNVTSSGIGTFKVLRVGSVDIKVDDSGNLYIINKDGKTAANFYTTGGITAYGASDATSSGGGLNGSVKSYADALKLASESLSEIASAYSIKALDSRIVSLEGGSAMDVSVSGSGNAVTAISKNGTTISVTKGITFLTSHQSLDGYVNEVATSGTGNAITSVSKSGKKLTFTKGATFLTSHQSLSAYLKSADAANTYSKLGHTHSQYLTSHQSFTDLCATLGVGGSVPTDDTEFITSYAGVGGFSYTNAVNVPYKRKASALWEYIKAKSDSLYQPVGNYAAANVNGGAAKWLLGSYTNNGGQQNPNYFGTNKIGALMMNTDVEGSTGYKDWIILDCYSGNDVGGAVAIGINRQSLGAYIMRSDSSRKTWNDKATLIGTHNYKTYVYSINDIDTKLSSYATQSWVTGKGYITSASSITGNAGSATKLQNSRKFWGNAFNGTEDIGGTILPSATHMYNLGSTTYMFERTYTRYIETDSGYDLRLVCSGNELMRLSSNDNSIYFDSQGLNIKNNVSSGCSMSISEVRDTELNYGQINVIDTNGSRPKGRHLVLQYEQGNVGIGVKYPSEKLEVNGNVLVNTTNTSGDKGLKIKANSRNLLFGVGTSTKIGVYSYSDSKWLFYTDTSTFYTSGGILATGGITAYSSSDIRLKQDLRKLDYLGIIKAMGGTFGFAWKKDNTRSIGWIAQHVLCNPHLKDIVETDEKGYYKINYWSPKLIATAFGAIEQVGDEISRLKARVVFLESEVQRLSGKQDGNNKKRLDNKNINLLN